MNVYICILVLYSFDAMDFNVEIAGTFKVLITRILDNLCHNVMTHAQTHIKQTFVGGGY